MALERWQWSKPSIAYNPSYDPAGHKEADLQIVQALLSGTPQQPIWLTLKTQTMDSLRRLSILYLEHFHQNFWDNEYTFTEIPRVSYPISELCQSFAISDPNLLAGMPCKGLITNDEGIEKLVAIKPMPSRPKPLGYSSSKTIFF
ncbi:MAG TPA: hypothetical protein VK158_06280 [Acidobacteriota bacterium]|nr:hypothetical protein [Acidobacteriota bacterium]